ncbi:MAG: DUF2721 domain-containing protein [Burkholderiaceae bacterium]
MIIEFHSTLAAALTPITLISGVGLLLLSMTNRYNHATDRVRQLLRERAAIAPRQDPVLEQAIHLIFARAGLLKNAILCVAVSAALSGALVLATVIEGLLGIGLPAIKAVMLVGAVGLIVISTVYFVLEVSSSLKALGISVNH